MYRDRGARARAAHAAANGPVNSVLPAITGTKQVGQTLSCSTGTWTKSPSFGRQWRRNGSAIVGATGATYVLQAGDQGTLISCTVTATANGISVDAISAQTTAIAA